MTMSVNLPAGFAQCAYRFSGAALPSGAAITFGLDQGTAGPSPAALAAALIAAWGTHIDPTVNSLVTLIACRVKVGPMDDGPFAELATSNAGPLIGSATSPAVSYLVRKNTGLGGKHGSGRMYVPGLGEGEVDETGSVSSSKLTALQNAWSAFFTALGTANTGMVLLHSFGTFTNANGEEVTVPPRAPTPCTSLTVDAKVATQRRRQRR